MLKSGFFAVQVLPKILEKESSITKVPLYKQKKIIKAPLTLQDRILDQAPKERMWLFTENGDAINGICFQPQNTMYIFSNCVIP